MSNLRTAKYDSVGIQIDDPNRIYQAVIYDVDGLLLTQDGVPITAGTSVTVAVVQALINQAIQNSSVIFNQLENKTGILGPLHIGPFNLDTQPPLDLVGAINYLNNKFSTQNPTTAPQISTVPNFSDTTPDEGQIITITIAGWTGTQPTSRSWRIDIENNGPLSFDVSVANFTVPVGAGGKPIKIIETAQYASGFVTATSITRTVNTPASPVPGNNTQASIAGIPQVGQIVTGAVGSASNSPTSYIKGFKRNGVVIPGVQVDSAATTLTYTLQQIDAGAVITFYDFPKNINGTGAETVSSGLTVAGGQAPSWIDPTAIQPGWTYGIFQVGVLMTLDLGAAANNPDPNAYIYQILRNGTPISGAAGSNVSSVTYLPVQLDQDQEISCLLTAKNAAGVATTVCASVTIAAGSGGGGGGSPTAVTLVGATPFGTNTAASGSIGNVPSTQAADTLIIFQSNNGNLVNTVPTGGGTWVQSGSAQSLTINDEQEAIFSKAATGSEPSTYGLAIASPDIFGALLVAYRGATTGILAVGTPVLSNVNNASPFSPTWNSITPTKIGDRIVLALILDHSAAAEATVTPPSGFSIDAQCNFTGNTNDWASICVMSKLADSTNPTGTLTAGVSLSAGAAGFITESRIIG